MAKLVEFWDEPKAEKVYMIAGWRQWADAGSISSTMPEYLIDQTGAKKIGAIKPGGYYIFQVPGTHHLLRPVIKLEDGYRQSLEIRRSEFYYAGDEKTGLVIFLGDEPHLNVDGYANAFFEAVHRLNVSRVITVGGVYGPMPYEKDREVSCVYSLPSMKDELKEYAVRFSNYEGGATIGSYLVDQAERELVELLAFYAFVPAYDFGQAKFLPQGIQIDQDYKAWYDLMRRINHMFGLSFNLSDLEQKTQLLMNAMEEQFAELESKIPQLDVKAYLDKVDQEFTERPFDPLADIWEEELKDLFDNLDE
ncbi:MAG: PAC2 family protein [Chloroflexi bacterium]|nr:PAC2 family protein [Chloroflexota bacterium]